MDDTPSSETPRSASGDVGIRISSDPDTTDIVQPDREAAREVSTHPFRMLLVSDLDPQRAASVDWEAATHVHRVDPNSFADLMAEMAPRLSLDVPNKTSDTAKTLSVDLTFEALDAFHPDQVAQQVPVLKQLLDVRALVRQVGRGEVTLEIFQDRLEDIGINPKWAADLYDVLEDPAAAPEATRTDDPSEDEALDRLLGMVDTASDESEAASSNASESPAKGASSNGTVGASPFIGALMDAVSGGASATGVDASEVAALDGLLTSTLTEQVEAIITHPDFRQLEAAWRGLKFLVDRLRFRDDVLLDVLPAARADLHEAIHYQVIVPEHSDDYEGASLSLMVVDLPFSNSHPDVEQLEDLAETGQSLQVPVLATVGAEFFGLERMSGLAKIPALRPYLQRSEYVEWNALRDEQAAQYLALAVPAFLLRYPYGARNRVEAFPLDEADGLFGSGALAVAVAAAGSFAETGWPTHLADYPIEDLPVQPGRGGHSPLEALLPGSKLTELAQAGFVVLGARPNHDAVRVVHAPTVRRPPATEDAEAAREARAHASLPCRFFVTRAAHYLITLQEAIEPGTSVEQVQDEATAALCTFLGARAEDADGAVAVERIEEGAQPGYEVLAVRMRPPAQVLGQDVRLVLGLRVPLAG